MESVPRTAAHQWANDSRRSKFAYRLLVAISAVSEEIYIQPALSVHGRRFG